MKVLIACDSFKGSLSSCVVGEAIAAGVGRVWPCAESVVLPLADGGEGTVEALVSGWGGDFVQCEVHGPLGRPVRARYGVSADGVTAVMEMAQSSGLTLIGVDERNPLLTTSFGVGEMVADALGRGCRHIVMGIGGSATCDGGMGMMEALGVRFLDESGGELRGCGESVGKVVSIDLCGLMPELSETQFTVACDVDNPLCGEMGAARVFAPQKGADDGQVRVLEAGLESYARVVEGVTGVNVATGSGAGAAGGLGAALMAFLHAEMRSGVEIVLDALGFDEHLQGVDIVFTGEGRIDAQTLGGKAPYGVLRRGRAHGVPVVALCGGVKDSDRLTEGGFAAVLPVVAGPCSVEEAMTQEAARANVERTAEMAVRLIGLGLRR